jgi:hypothetical protein
MDRHWPTNVGPIGCGRAVAWNAANRLAAESAQADFVTL